MENNYLDEVPISYRALQIKAANGKCSPRQAIKAKCQECVGFENVSDGVKNCTAKTCPLWRFRPYTGKAVRKKKPLTIGKG